MFWNDITLKGGSPLPYVITLLRLVASCIVVVEIKRF